MKFEVYQSKVSGLLSNSGEWRWRLKAANGEIVASGEGYKNKIDCLKAVVLVKNTTASTPVTEVVA